MKYLYFICCMLCAGIGFSQDPASLLAEGLKLEQRLKDEEAIAKYKEVLVIQPSNLQANVKIAEINYHLGQRQSDPVVRAACYAETQKFAKAARKIDSVNAEVNYVTALGLMGQAEVAEKKEEMFDHIRVAREYIGRATVANPNFGKAWHLMGKWEYEILTLSELKKAMVKTLYGGLPPATMEDAIRHMEKCKTLEPYFAPNFYDLAKAYQYNKQYEKALDIAEKLQKLPSRRQYDVDAKTKGLVLLKQLK